jgi:hypothetical protein
MIVATVLKSGGDFLPEHVTHLHDNLIREIDWKRAAYQKLRFVCLTDIPDQVPYFTIPLTEGLAGAHSQIELFKPRQFRQQVLYLDLDTLILDDIVELFEYGGPICMLKDFLYDRLKKKRYLASGMMLWNPHEYPEIPRMLWGEYERNKAKYKAKRRKHRVSYSFFQMVLGQKQDVFQDLFPGRIVSYKEHCCNNWAEKKFIGFPDGAKVVCFHGKPRPWQTDLWEDYSAKGVNE